MTALKGILSGPPSASQCWIILMDQQESILRYSPERNPFWAARCFTMLNNPDGSTRINSTLSLPSSCLTPIHHDDTSWVGLMTPRYAAWGMTIQHGESSRLVMLNASWSCIMTMHLWWCITMTSHKSSWWLLLNKTNVLLLSKDDVLCWTQRKQKQKNIFASYLASYHSTYSIVFLFCDSASPRQEAFWPSYHPLASLPTICCTIHCQRVPK